MLRKLAHVTEYAVLTLCWWRALRGLGVRLARSRPRSRSASRYAARTSSTRPSWTAATARRSTSLIDAIGMAIAALAI